MGEIMPNYKKLIVVACVILSACGGGGGGSSTTTSSSSSSSTVFCINSQVSGCSYNSADATQSDFGWWQGTITINGSSRNAYYSATSLGAFQIYIGDTFSTGYFQGTSSKSGSVLSLESTLGVDPLAVSTFVAALTSATGGVGGVITQKILSFTQPLYNLANNSMTMSYTYNAFGDQPLSNFVGNYTNGTSNLTIASNGQMTTTYPAPIFIAFNTNQLCTLTTTVATTTLMKNVTLSGTDSCGIANTMRLYYFTLSGTNHMVLRLFISNNLSQKAVVF